MKKLIPYLLLTLILVSCGVDSHHFRLDGRLINLNQGEFYVYSPDGGIEGMDTIKVVGGRFSYEIACEKPSILMIVFPNFSEQPVFAEPGGEADIKGDASHLKEMEITGTKNNKLMTEFRKLVNNASPPEITKQAGLFIADHPESEVSGYLVGKYFLMTRQPDASKALQMLSALMEKQKENGYLARLYTKAKSMPSGNTLPAIAATDLDGKRITRQAIAAAPVAVIATWASWSYDSMNQLRQLKSLYDEMKGRLVIVAVNVDADPEECRRTVEREQWKWPVVCDGNMFEGAPVKQLGMTNVPDNILLQNGRVVARGLTTVQLRERVEKQK